ncbi:helix-hairpin-helix domain-containing protein [Streptomyces sp. SGAir0957]
MSTESAAAENESGASPDAEAEGAVGVDEPENPEGAADGVETGDGVETAETDETGEAAESEETARNGNAAGSEETAGSGNVAEGGETADSGETDETAEPADSGDGSTGGEQLSEAEAELAAQRALRERIAERKAAKEGPVDAGAKLSGTAADLLAAVRAVESGDKPAAVFAEPERGPRRVVTAEPVRRPAPVAPAVQTGPDAGTVDAVRAVLAEGGAPETLAVAAARTLGEDAGERLRADPWQLLRLSGVRPEQADGFARALLGAECAPDDERRGRAVTVWLLEQATVAGHTALDLPVLVEALGKRGVPQPDAAVESAVAEGEALLFQDALDDAPEPAPAQDAEADEDVEAAERPVRVLVGLERTALAEESLADGLARLINSAPKDGRAAGPEWEEAAVAAGGTTAELIRAVHTHSLVLHTGGEAARVEPVDTAAAAARLGLRVCVAAHGTDGRRRAARRLGDGAPESATATVAGLLAQTEGPGRDGDGAIAVDLLVVLDAPQLDVDAAAVLAESLPDGACLLLSGDPGVLWSAGPGRVFADLVAAGICPRVSSRTPDPGPIGELVSGIGIGELNQVEAPGKEVVIVPVRDAAEAIHRTVQLVADSVPRAIGVPAEETRVITPGHGGAAGTRALNAALKERLNPGPGRFGGFDPGDRVAYVPAPGQVRTGLVRGADAEGLRLECDGEPVLVPKEQVERGAVRHGWALTAHQAVGLRSAAAVVVLPGDATQALSRPWVYTAFGRGERHLSVVHGVDAALPRAVAEIPAKPRTTRLQRLVTAQLPQA